MVSLSCIPAEPSMNNILHENELKQANPNSKVHGANMGPTWVLSAPNGPHVGPMNLVIREGLGHTRVTCGQAMGCHCNYLVIKHPFQYWDFRVHCNYIQYSCMCNLIDLFNSLRPSDAYMRQHNMPTLLQIMACRLFSAKPLSKPMLPYYQLDPTEHISVKFYSKFKSFHSRSCTWKCPLRNGSHFVLASMC